MVSHLVYLKLPRKISRLQFQGYYQVQTILGDRILESPCQSPSVAATIESLPTELEQGPSSVAGLGLGLVYATIGILLFVASILRRSD